MTSLSRKSPKVLRLVLLGKTGSGKSATGNTILGKEKFKSKLSGSSVTSSCIAKSAKRFKRKIVVVDTPGTFDTGEPNSTILKQIANCIPMTSPGPHAFIMVINIAAKHTEEEVASIEHFVRIFGEEVYKYLLVLFTREDELVKNRTELDTFIRGCPQHLQTFVEKCGNRMLAINNEQGFSKNKQRVKLLLNNIEQNVENNGGTCYTNEMYQQTERVLRLIENDQMMATEIERIPEESENQMRDQNCLTDEIYQQTEEKEQMMVREMEKEPEESENQIRDQNCFTNEMYQQTEEKEQMMVHVREMERGPEESENQIRDQIREELQNCSDFDSTTNNQINWELPSIQVVWQIVQHLLTKLAECCPNIIVRLRGMIMST